MKLYLARHAQSESNAGVHRGNETILTKTGIEQAKRLGMSFKKKNINRIYCSKMIRAMDTLEEIKPYLRGVPITYTEKINERNKGIFENKPDGFKKAVEKSGLKEHEFRPINGENLQDLEKRAGKFLEFLKNNHPEDNVLVVAHGYFLRVLISKIFNLHIKEIQYFDLHNAGVSSFSIDKKGKVGKFEIDDYKHLIKYSSYKR
jgi:phosphoserine phosphatase